MAYLGNSPGVASQRVESAFTATASQTVFTPSSGYTLGYCDVYQNGVKLVNGDDYTAADGATVTLTTGAATGDSIVIVASFPRGLSDGYLKSEADAKYATLTDAASTANGVLYRNGSKVLTTGSALTFDGTTLIVGTPSGTSAPFVAKVPNFDVETTGYATIGARGYGTGAANAGVLVLGRSNSATLGTLTATTNNQHLGLIGFEGVNSSNAAQYAAYIQVAQEGTNGATWVPSYMSFFTGTNAASPAERMRIDSAGNVSLSNGTFTQAATNSGTTFTGEADPARVFAYNPSTVNGAYNGYGIEVKNAGNTTQVASIIAASTSSGYAPNLIFGQRTGATAWTERMRIDSAGNLGIGVTPSAWASSVKAVQLGARTSLFQYNGTTSDLMNNGYFDGGEYRYLETATATFYRQSTGRHQFYCASSGTAGAAIGWTNVIQVEKDYTLALQGGTSTAGAGIAFPATQVASTNANTLDDYEEGSWTPILKFGGGTTGISYQTNGQQGTYVKIGRNVTVTCYIYTVSTGSDTGNMTVAGLPFAAGTTSSPVNIDYYFPYGARGGTTIPSGAVPMTYLSPSSNFVDFYYTPVTTSGNPTRMTKSNMAAGVIEISFQFSYMAAA